MVGKELGELLIRGYTEKQWGKHVKRITGFYYAKDSNSIYLSLEDLITREYPISFYLCNALLFKGSDALKKILLIAQSSNHDISMMEKYRRGLLVYSEKRLKLLNYYKLKLLFMRGGSK